MHRNKLTLRTLMVASLIGFRYSAFFHNKMPKLEPVQINKPRTAPDDSNGKAIPSGRLKITPTYHPKLPKTRDAIMAIDLAQWRKEQRRKKARFNYVRCLDNNPCHSDRKIDELLYG